MSGVHDITAQFEDEICRYTGAPFCVALDNASNALFLSLYYQNVVNQVIEIPSHTYPSVPCEIIHAGGIVQFVTSNKTLTGAYRLGKTRTFDSALRFTCDMYIPDSFMCLSFTGPFKTLKLGKGGAILTDDSHAYRWFKRARFSGRRECSYFDDELDCLGWNFYMMPEIAALGLHMMPQFYDRAGVPVPQPDLELTYPNLSKFPIYSTDGIEHGK